MLVPGYDVLAGPPFLLRVGASDATGMTGRDHSTYRIASLLIYEQPSLLGYTSVELYEILDLYLSGSLRLGDDRQTGLPQSRQLSSTSALAANL